MTASRRVVKRTLQLLLLSSSRNLAHSSVCCHQQNNIFHHKIQPPTPFLHPHLRLFSSTSDPDGNSKPLATKAQQEREKHKSDRQKDDSKTTEDDNATPAAAERTESDAPSDEATETKENKKENKNKTVMSKMKNYIFKRRDYSKKFTDNNTVTPVQAMTEYVLKPSDLEGLPQIKVRSPYNVGAELFVYREKDVRRRAMEVHGTLKDIENIRAREFGRGNPWLESENGLFNKLRAEDSNSSAGAFGDEDKTNVWRSGAGRVVLFAAGMNAVVFMGKFVSFLSTGSPSMFSESLHSMADTLNQLLLLWGINESTKQPDPKHPYGRRNMRHIMSLISGVGIFCLGSGVSVYHGLEMLMQGGQVADVATFWSFAVLMMATVMESTSLYVAYSETKQQALKHNLPVLTYVKEAGDPSTNVVLLEDSAAVVGNLVAASALTLSYYTGSVVPDAVGAILIGGVLGTLASFIVTTNINFLVGRSIPLKQLHKMKEQLEDDVVVRGVYDVKATMTSVEEFKFKAEIDFDGLEVTRAYLTQIDRKQAIREFQAIETLEDFDTLMLHHGEQIIDELGAQVDRLETQLKRQNPGLRHIDLEVL